jgi:CDP-diacylglycerol--glycerol-3-phosphate 3-phosphatidyltransferase
MPSVYQLKPRFLALLAPLTARLAHRGVTANQVTTLACLLSIGYGAALSLLQWQQLDAVRWLWLGLPLFLFIRMALNAIDGQLARDYGQKSRLGGLLNEMGDVLADAGPAACRKNRLPISIFVIVLSILKHINSSINYGFFQANT